MKFADFTAANVRRCESPEGFNHRLDSWSLSDWYTATSGELGEAGNVIKKLNRFRDGVRGNKVEEPALRAQLRREIGDAFIYLDLFAAAAGFTIEDAAVESFNAKCAEIGYPSLMTSDPLAHNRTEIYVFGDFPEDDGRRFNGSLRIALDGVDRASAFAAFEKGAIEFTPDAVVKLYSINAMSGVVMRGKVTSRSEYESVRRWAVFSGLLIASVSDWRRMKELDRGANQ